MRYIELNPVAAGMVQSRTQGDRDSALVSETVTDAQVGEVAFAAIDAIDQKPHGVYGVDMTYDHDAVPNPTEINIGRFFTTIDFFAAAGRTCR